MSKYEPAIPPISPFDDVILGLMALAATVAICFLAGWACVEGYAWLVWRMAGTI
jgi:hypothetical protein